MFGLDTFEIVVIVLLAIVLFGRDLPSVARAVGRGLGEFRRSLKGIETEVKDSLVLANRPEPHMPSPRGDLAHDTANTSQETNPFPEEKMDTGPAPAEPEREPDVSSPRDDYQI